MTAINDAGFDVGHNTDDNVGDDNTACAAAA